MRHGGRRWFWAAAMVVGIGVATSVSAAEFPLKDGDTWVMAGDSITAQHLHSKYFEAFCYARYPKLRFRFRNSGVGGDTIGSLLKRFEWDVAAWKPTVVSVELGMNDQGSGATAAQYVANMSKLTEKIRAIQARPVFFTASPKNTGEGMGRLGSNTRLEQYATALKAYASEQKAPFADQFHALVDVWATQKGIEQRAALMTTLTEMAKDEKLAGVGHLRAFLAEQAKTPAVRAVSMEGDAVHPGATGQLMMAAALLKDLGAEEFVSGASVDAAGGKVASAKGCTIQAVKTENGRVSFDRLDECLPFPIPDEARGALAVYPAILELSRYELTVTGLAEGDYELRIDGQAAGTVSAKELATGVNLTALPKGVIAGQMKEMLAAVSAKETLVSAWRAQSKQLATGPADARQKLDDLAKGIEAADQKIREAAKPRVRHFELAPLKAGG